jgi:hypothetical protein
MESARKYAAHLRASPEIIATARSAASCDTSAATAA